MAHPLTRSPAGDAHELGNPADLADLAQSGKGKGLSATWPCRMPADLADLAQNPSNAGIRS